MLYVNDKSLSFNLFTKFHKTKETTKNKKIKIAKNTIILKFAKFYKILTYWIND